MTPEQWIALLLVIADQRIVIEQLRQQLNEANQRAQSANGEKVKDEVRVDG